MARYIYINIPFCTKKCSYCDFYSIPLDIDLAAKYVSAICKEIALNLQRIERLKTIYLGGGTPALLDDKALRSVVLFIEENCGLDKGAEITIEANPESISVQKAEKFLKAGINRISIGVQSFLDDDLFSLGRNHTALRASEAVSIIKSAGFKNLSIDLIYGIPDKTGLPMPLERALKSWQYSLLKTIELNPEHISIYELTPEPDTRLYNEIRSKRILMLDDNVVSEMYYTAKEILEKHGYLHYEISNFAKPGYECIHNLNYWHGDDYLGIGAGAHSFVNGVRYSNVRDVHIYISAVENGENAIIEKVELNAQDRLKELIFLGLRKTNGFEIKRIPEENLKKLQIVIEDLIDYNLLELKDGYLRLSKKGLILSSEVMIRLLRACD